MNSHVSFTLKKGFEYLKKLKEGQDEKELVRGNGSQNQVGEGNILGNLKFNSCLLLLFLISVYLPVPSFYKLVSFLLPGP